MEIHFNKTYRAIQNAIGLPHSCWNSTLRTNQNKTKCNTDLFFNQTYTNHTPLTHPIPFLPESRCKQVVLGTFELIAPYFQYNRDHPEDPPFILLSSHHWSDELNKNFVSCAFALLLHNNTCQYPIRIVLPSDPTQLVRINKNGKRSPRITLLELCIVLQEMDHFTFYQMSEDPMLYLLKPKVKGGKRRTRRARRAL